jgi:hypothetical protein
MDIAQPNSESHRRVPGRIEALYPVPPLSWLAPLWSYVCGVIASSPATGTAASGAYDPVGRTASHFAGDWTGGGVLLFLLGMLLAGPLLGAAWRASGQIRFYRELAIDLPGNAPPKPLRPIPYTLPGSASDMLSSWLGVVSARLQRIAPELGMPLLRLAVSTVFSLAVAAELGQRTLAITAAALLCVYAHCLGRARWEAQRPRSRADGAACQVMDVFLPILLTWLIGHATYAAMHAESVLVAACFALALGGCPRVHQTGKGLLGLLLPQVVVVVYFIVARQPVTAAGATLLASSQLLWSPLLQMPAGRTKYFRAVQLPLATTMLLAACTLRYGL